MYLSDMLRKKMNNLFKITVYTLRDQMRHKSFYVLLAVSVLFVLLIRGCYEGNYTVNNQKVDNVTVAFYASKIAFHIIACGMFLLVAMLSMRIFSRDQSDGSTVLFLSRSVNRWQYVFGRVFGTWSLSFLFMFILHLTIFLTAWSKTGGRIPGYLTASCICSINLLFVAILVCLLSLFMPDFIAGIATMGLIVVGFISDGIYLVMQNKMVQSALQENVTTEPALWRIIYPKISLLQHYAVSFIDKGEFHSMGPVHPIINVFLYTLIAAGILIWSFNRREI